MHLTETFLLPPSYGRSSSLSHRKFNLISHSDDQKFFTEPLFFNLNNELFQWIFQELKSSKSWSDVKIRDSFLCAAARNGLLDLVQSYASQINNTDKIVLNAAVGGHLHLVQWAHNKGWQLFSNHKIYANPDTFLYKIQQLRIYVDDCQSSVVLFASLNGDLKMLEWCADNKGLNMDGRYCLAAAAGGHLDVLKWLRARGCFWDKRTCLFAIRGGQLPALKWAIANGCQSEGLLQEAEKLEQKEIVNWLKENANKSIL